MEQQTSQYKTGIIVLNIRTYSSIVGRNVQHKGREKAIAKNSKGRENGNVATVELKFGLLRLKKCLLSHLRCFIATVLYTATHCCYTHYIIAPKT